MSRPATPVVGARPVVLAVAVDVVELPPVPLEQFAPRRGRRPAVAGSIRGAATVRSVVSVVGSAQTSSSSHPAPQRCRRPDRRPLVGVAVRVDRRRSDDLSAVATDVEAGAEPTAGVVADVSPVGRPAEQEVEPAGARDAGACRAASRSAARGLGSCRSRRRRAPRTRTWDRSGPVAMPTPSVVGPAGVRRGGSTTSLDGRLRRWGVGGGPRCRAVQNLGVSARVAWIRSGDSPGGGRHPVRQGA